MSSLPSQPAPDTHPSLSLSGHQAQSTQATPLNDAQFSQIKQACQRARPINKAVRFATLSGWMTLGTGALSLPFVLGDTPMIIFMLIIAGIGTRELTLRRSLNIFELRAANKLAFNQLILGAAIGTYAIVKLMSPAATTLVESAMQSDPNLAGTPEVAGMMSDMIELEKMVNKLIYIAMIPIAIIVQGSTALYYHLKGRKLNALLNNTPGWIIKVLLTTR